MGCDIHLFVEKKIGPTDGVTNKAYWISIDKWVKNDYYYSYPNEPEWVLADDEKYTSRNYVLFGILADVRNEDANIVPIASPRGLPKDVTKEIQILSDHEGTDAHSHSWLRVDEVMNYDWNKIYTEEGKAYLHEGKPITYGECCKDFIKGFIPDLLKVEKPENLRIVFWFDN